MDFYRRLRFVGVLLLSLFLGASVSASSLGAGSVESNIIRRMRELFTRRAPVGPRVEELGEEEPDVAGPGDGRPVLREADRIKYLVSPTGSPLREPGAGCERDNYTVSDVSSCGAGEAHSRDAMGDAGPVTYFLEFSDTPTLVSDGDKLLDPNDGHPIVSRDEFDGFADNAHWNRTDAFAGYILSHTLASIAKKNPYTEGSGEWAASFSSEIDLSEYESRDRVGLIDPCFYFVQGAKIIEAGEYSSDSYHEAIPSFVTGVVLLHVIFMGYKFKFAQSEGVGTEKFYRVAQQEGAHKIAPSVFYYINKYIGKYISASDEVANKAQEALRSFILSEDRVAELFTRVTGLAKEFMRSKYSTSGVGADADIIDTMEAYALQSVQQRLNRFQKFREVLTRESDTPLCKIIVCNCIS